MLICSVAKPHNLYMRLHLRVKFVGGSRVHKGCGNPYSYMIWIQLRLRATNKYIFPLIEWKFKNIVEFKGKMGKIEFIVAH
jgi:hypothetical protein